MRAGTLLADPANNPASWHPDGRYRSRYIQGYTHLFAKSGHSRKQTELFDKLNRTSNYPQPVVDHAFARDRALQAYKNHVVDEEYE
jgi:deoxyribodipyrimidine photo-lyase